MGITARKYDMLRTLGITIWQLRQQANEITPQPAVAAANMQQVVAPSVPLPSHLMRQANPQQPVKKVATTPITAPPATAKPVAPFSLMLVQLGAVMVVFSVDQLLNDTSQHVALIARMLVNCKVVAAGQQQLQHRFNWPQLPIQKFDQGFDVACASLRASLNGSRSRNSFDFLICLGELVSKYIFIDKPFNALQQEALHEFMGIPTIVSLDATTLLHDETTRKQTWQDLAPLRALYQKTTNK